MLASAGGPPGGGSGAGDQGHQGQALLAALGRALKQLAQRFALGVLATNHLVGGVGTMSAFPPRKEPKISMWVPMEMQIQPSSI
jgi:hypothetical protein